MVVALELAIDIVATPMVVIITHALSLPPPTYTRLWHPPNLLRVATILVEIVAFAMVASHIDK